MNLLTFAWGAKVFSFNLPQVFGSNKNFRHMVWQYKVVGSMYNGMKSYLKEPICFHFSYTCFFVCFYGHIYTSIQVGMIASCLIKPYQSQVFFLSNGSLGWLRLTVIDGYYSKTTTFFYIFCLLICNHFSRKDFVIFDPKKS